MKLIVGLGNPDKTYENTRHNIGFMAIDSYAEKNNYTFRMEKSFIGEIYKDREFILLKPHTYMNLSGNSVSLVASYFKIDPKDILIISDDFNLEFSKIRYRDKGSAGGHNGLKSIISSLNTEEFPRLRIGLGNPTINTINFVLSRFGKEELDTLHEVFTRTNKMIDAFIENKTTQEIQTIGSNDWLSKIFIIS